MKKIAGLILTVVLLCSLVGCALLPFVGSPVSAKGNSSVQVAWEGDFSTDELRDTIVKYQRSFSPMLYKDVASGVSFEVDYEAKGLRIPRVSAAGKNDVDDELVKYVDSAVEGRVDGTKITVVPVDFSEDTLEGCSVWSYVVCVVDTDGNDHYYYFRVDYK